MTGTGASALFMWTTFLIQDDTVQLPCAICEHFSSHPRSGLASPKVRALLATIFAVLTLSLSRHIQLIYRGEGCSTLMRTRYPVRGSGALTWIFCGSTLCSSGEKTTFYILQAPSGDMYIYILRHYRHISMYATDSSIKLNGVLLS